MLINDKQQHQLVDHILQLILILLSVIHIYEILFYYQFHVLKIDLRNQKKS